MTNIFYYFEGCIYEKEEEVIKATKNFVKKRYDKIETENSWSDFYDEFYECIENGDSDLDALLSAQFDKGFRDDFIANTNDLYQAGYIEIGGINHARYVGVNIETGDMCDFDYLNIEHYRPLLNEDELTKAINVARDYYNSCIEEVRTGDFEVIEAYNGD